MQLLYYHTTYFFWWSFLLTVFYINLKHTLSYCVQYWFIFLHWQPCTCTCTSTFIAQKCSNWNKTIKLRYHVIHLTSFPLVTMHPWPFKCGVLKVFYGWKLTDIFRHTFIFDLILQILTHFDNEHFLQEDKTNRRQEIQESK